MNLQDLTDALSQHMPPVLRWAGAMAQQLRHFDISVTGKKTSGSATTDALTLADLSVIVKTAILTSATPPVTLVRQMAV